ncbi:MAG: hypothetical protein AAGC74_05180 [Verrucomicrobiota bacterium]
MQWLAFPGLLRGIAILHFVLIVALMFRPGMGQFLTFDWAKILQGEVWRLVSFLLLVIVHPPDAPPNPSPFLLLFSFFALMIGFLINDTLESEWGVLRTSIYLYATMAGQIAANLVLSTIPALGEAIPIGGRFLYFAAFFAFATLVPKYIFRLFFFLPVPVWILGILSGSLILFGAFASPTSFGIFALLTFAPYLAWAIPLAFERGKNHSEVAKRRFEFETKKNASLGSSFHRCARCGASENSHPERDFRILGDEEICSVCLEAQTQSDS